MAQSIVTRSEEVVDVREPSGEGSPPSLGRRTLGGMLWMSIGVFGQVVVQIVVLIVLARHVSPSDFGVAAAALVVLRLSLILSDSGVGPALVQRKELRADHIRVAFTVTSLLGLMSWCLIIAIAPAVAALFGIPHLTPVLRVIGAVFFLRSITVGDHLLQRELEFRRLTAVELTSLVLGYGVVSIVLAVTGAGVWAIVWGHVAQAGLRTAFLWYMRPHAFRPSLARQPLGELVRFGAALTVAQLAAVVATQADNFIVGRWLGAYALGLYGRAYQLMVMPALLFGNVMNRVLFPAMAAVHGNQERLRKAYTMGVAVITVLALPLTVLLAVTSREVIVVVLGTEWLPMLSAFNVLVFCILFRTGYKVSDCLTLATGAVRRRATRQWTYAGLVVLGSLVGQRWGLFGVAAGLAVALALNYALMAQLSMTIIDLSWRGFVGTHQAGVFVSMFVLAAAWPAAIALRASATPAAVVLVGTMCAAGFGAFAAIRAASFVPGGRALAELIGGVRTLLGSSTATGVVDRIIGRPREGVPEGGRAR